MKKIILIILFVFFIFPPSVLAVTFTENVQAPADDALERSDDTNFTTNPVLDIGLGIVYGRSGAGGTPFWYSGHRFSGVTIPQGTIINSAKVTFTSRGNWTMTSGITVVIRAENVNNSANFTTTADIVNRVVTTANTSWSAPSSGTTNVSFDTADITSSVQEVINRAGWVSGNALMIIFKETVGTDSEANNVYYYENSTTQSAIITIVYGEDSTELFSIANAIGSWQISFFFSIMALMWGLFMIRKVIL